MPPISIANARRGPVRTTRATSDRAPHDAGPLHRAYASAAHVVVGAADRRLAALEAATRAFALRCKASGLSATEALVRVRAVTRPPSPAVGEDAARDVTVFGAVLCAYYAPRGAWCGSERPRAADGPTRRARERGVRTMRRPSWPAREYLTWPPAAPAGAVMDRNGKKPKATRDDAHNPERSDTKSGARDASDRLRANGDAKDAKGAAGAPGARERPGRPRRGG